MYGKGVEDLRTSRRGEGNEGEEGTDGLDEEAMRYDVGGSSKTVWSEELRNRGLGVPWEGHKA